MKAACNRWFELGEDGAIWRTQWLSRNIHKIIETTDKVDMAHDMIHATTAGITRTQTALYL